MTDEMPATHYLHTVLGVTNEVVAAVLTGTDNQERQERMAEILAEKSLSDRGKVDVLNLVVLSLAAVLTPEGPWRETELAAVRENADFHMIAAFLPYPLTGDTATADATNERN